MNKNSINALKNIHAEEDIFIVGTGPSSAFFPQEFFKDKITIGCNKAWESNPYLSYGITIHPNLNTDFSNKICSSLKWIIKRDKFESELSPTPLPQETLFFLYDIKESDEVDPPNNPKSSSRDLSLLNAKQTQFLYQWSTISGTAVHLAYIMGARNIYLIGCDCAPLNDADHANAQHTRWRGSSPKIRYNQYQECLFELKTHLAHQKINIFSIVPFIGISNYSEQAIKLENEFGIQLKASRGDIDKIRLYDWIKWLVGELKSKLKK